MSVQTERDAALLEVQRVARLYCQTPIVVFLRGESGVVRDTYQSIAQFTQAGGISIYAWPILYEPDQRELDRAGIYERCDVLVWTPTKEWTDQGKSFASIDTLRSTAVVFSSDNPFPGGLEYKIRYRARAVRYGDTDLHITLALTKRE